MIVAHEKLKDISYYVPNYFIQTVIPDGNEWAIMEISGVMVNLLVEMDPEVYGKYVVYENRRKVLYVQVLRTMYGMLIAYLLWYNKFYSDLE